METTFPSAATNSSSCSFSEGCNQALTGAVRFSRVMKEETPGPKAEGEDPQGFWERRGGDPAGMRQQAKTHLLGGLRNALGRSSVLPMRYLLILVVAGCAAVDASWVKEGKTLDDQNKDYAECSEPYQGRTFAFGMAGAASANPQIRECMLKKGWKPAS